MTTKITIDIQDTLDYKGLELTPKELKKVISWVKMDIENNLERAIDDAVDEVQS